MKATYKKKHCYWCYIFKKIFFLGITFSMPACDSFLDVELPKSQLTSSTVFQDYATADAAMADVYSKIRDTGLLSGTLTGLTVQLGNYADELTFYGSPTDATLSFYTNAVLPSNSTVTQFWNNSYNQIYAVNAILEGVSTATFSTQEKAQLKGEALFVRGLLHFYLLQLFGEIPYVQTTNYNANSAVSKIPSDQIYAHVKADLKAAELLLSPSYLTTDKIRPNSFVAKALLARVYLYKGEWNNADKMATEVIENNTLYGFENNLDKVFLKNSTEAIWQFMPALSGQNTDEATVFIFTSGPPPLVALSESLINSFDENDLRKSHWIASVSDENETWYYAYKYKESISANTSKEYSIVLRLTEQYLIRAEARIQEENHIGAKEDLNRIRNRAGLSNISTGSKEEILSAIMEERRKEFFTEYGHRFFDLKRMGKLDTALSTKTGWNTTDGLLPLPESELITNPNLNPQNPGY